MGRFSSAAVGRSPDRLWRAWLAGALGEASSLMGSPQVVVMIATGAIPVGSGHVVVLGGGLARGGAPA